MSIKIFINGKEEEFEKEMTVAELLKEKNIRPEVVTVEVNEELVDKEDYEKTVLKDQDEVEMVFYIGGGR